MNIVYKISYALTYAISRLPLKVLYGISDCLFPLIYHVFRYRRKTVRKNLTSSFPEMDRKQLKKTERQFYHFLCDCFFEIIKMLTISKEDLMQLIDMRNTEAIEQCFDRGQNCSALLGHYCNWELIGTVGQWMKRHTGAVFGIIYHPLKSKIAEQVFIDIRQSQGGTCIPKNLILRRLATYRREDRRVLSGFVADQSPKWENIHLWLNFLNHDTAVFTGGERIMRKMDDAVFYVDLERPRRGKYVATFQLMTEHAAQTAENEITKRYFQLLEETIRREPQYYLWSHKRWKRSHEEFDRRFKVVNGKVMKRTEEDNKKPDNKCNSPST